MDQQLDLKCRVPDEHARVTLFYRNSGQEHFTPVVMQRRGYEHHGSIPSQEVVGGALQYYLEARDASGTLVGESGRASDPHTLPIVCPCMPLDARRRPAP